MVVAYANFCTMVPRMGRDSAPDGPTPAQQEVLSDALKTARSYRELRPGDLWISDLLARSMVEGCLKQASSMNTSPWLKLMASLAKELIGRSVLFKLLDIETIPSEVAKECRLQDWLGLDVLTREPDAESCRAVLEAELVPRAISSKNPAVRGMVVLLFKQLMIQVAEPDGMHTRDSSRVYCETCSIKNPSFSN